VRAEGEVPDTVPGEIDVEEEAARRLATERVRRLCDTLAPDQRDVLLLRMLADLTVDDIAEALGKTPGAVKALQRRGLAALRRQMQREGVPL
jgi:RNA polymerase sigma-70 factor (ECF subfamily)